MAKKKSSDDAQETVTPEISDDVVEAEQVDEAHAVEGQDAPDDTVEVAEDLADLVDHADEDHEDDHHVSVAARSLQILGILAAGAVIGIWAAPRIAPQLPAGMAPIAQWLSPSNNAAIEDVDRLRIELETRLTALELLPTRTEIESRLANFQTDTVNPVRTQMTALSDQVAAADSTAVESRLWALEGRVEGLIVEIESLTESLGSVAAEGGAISADTAATISAYRSRIDGLQASLDEMSSLQGALSQRIDEVAATAERQVIEAETLVAEATVETAATVSNTEIQAALTQINAALRSGAGFSAPLARIASNSDQTAPVALLAAQSGVETLEELQASFVSAAHSAIRAEISEKPESGLFGSFGSFVKSQVATRSLTPQEGDSADAVLSRIEAALDQQEFAKVLSESQALSEAAKSEMAGWLALVALRHEAEIALEALENQFAPEAQQ